MVRDNRLAGGHISPSRHFHADRIQRSVSCANNLLGRRRRSSIALKRLLDQQRSRHLHHRLLHWMGVRLPIGVLGGATAFRIVPNPYYPAAHTALLGNHKRLVRHRPPEPTACVSWLLAPCICGLQHSASRWKQKRRRPFAASHNKRKREIRTGLFPFRRSRLLRYRIANHRPRHELHGAHEHDRPGHSTGGRLRCASNSRHRCISRLEADQRPATLGPVLQVRNPRADHRPFPRSVCRTRVLSHHAIRGLVSAFRRGQRIVLG